jgi:HAD superfamily hydrolase (TIGR01509 family)
MAPTMVDISNIAAVIFDMDGTLVDSELLTEPTVRAFCREAGIGEPGLVYAELYGLSWARIATLIAARHPRLAGTPDSARRLHEIFEKKCTDDPPVAVRGARQAMMDAHARMPTAIVSASYRESIDATIRRMDIEAHVTYYAGADDYARHKPAPDGFLQAASVLGIPPGRCLVFEDSLAGIQSAIAAGMPVVAITHRSNDVLRATALANRAIRNFTELASGYFDQPN